MPETNKIPMLYASDPDFKANLDFELQSTQSNSDYRNDRERPYNGQPWTDDGTRGKTEVKGLTMRDIKDCFVMAVLDSAAEDDYLNKDFSKCWDYSTDPPKPTQFLLDMQAKGKYVSTKVDTGNWRPQDVYNIVGDIDLLAVGQNLCCRIEKMMGIFPNIPPGEDNLEDILP